MVRGPGARAPRGEQAGKLFLPYRSGKANHEDVSMTEREIEFFPTPNPNAVKFVLGRPAVPEGGSRSYYSAEQAASDARAAALFELDGVASVFMVADFVTVTKTPEADWGSLIEPVRGVLGRSG
jgi:hypothetical protein